MSAANEQGMGTLLTSDDLIIPEFAGGPIERAPWLDDARRELRELRLLDRDWDSYGALEVDAETIRRSFELVWRLASEDTVPPPPTIVASTDGGVRFQWNLRETFILIQVDPHASPTLFYERPSGESWEGTLGEEPTPLVKLFWELTV